MSEHVVGSFSSPDDVVSSPAEGAAIVQPSASYSITIRARLPQRPGAFGQVASAIGETGAILGAIDLVRVEHGTKLRDITVACIDGTHGERVVEAVRSVPDVTVESVSDRTFLMHIGGKIEVNGTVPVKTRDDLSMAYTPGVARVCTANRRGAGAGVVADRRGQHGRRRLPVSYTHLTLPTTPYV